MSLAHGFEGVTISWASKIAWYYVWHSVGDVMMAKRA